MANPILVASGDEITDSESTNITKEETNTVFTKPTRTNTLESRGLSEQASTLIVQSWRENTRHQYKPYIKKWELYCSKQINPVSPTVEQGINFLAELYNTGVGYSAINTARSALSSVIVIAGNPGFGQHPLVSRFMKGIFESRPSLHRYKETWFLYCNT